MESPPTPPPSYEPMPEFTPVPPPQQPGNTVVYLPPGQPATVPWIFIPQPRVAPNYKYGQSIGLGITMIVAGSLSIILNAIALGVGYYGFGFVGHGFWGGIMCVIAGGFGIGAGKNKTVGQIRACMVLSIIAACLCLGELTAAIMGCVFLAYAVNLIVQILLAIMALVGGTCSLLVSCYGCQAACCCNDYQAPYGVMQYGAPIQMVTQSNGQLVPMAYSAVSAPNYAYSMPPQQGAAASAPQQITSLPAAGDYGPPSYQLIKYPDYVAPPPDHDY
jgi:hypothetical protein